MDKRYKHIVLLAFLFILTVILGRSVVCAEEVSFRASAPAQVIVGNPFQLTYTVNQRAKDFQAPEFTDFDYLAGPYTSQSSSTSFINGKRTSTFTLTYTFTLMPSKEGTYTIAPASIKADGEYYQSNGVRITVLPPDEPVGNTSSQNNAGNRQYSNSAQQQTNRQTGSADNIFIRTIVTKTNVYEQESFLVTYKLYFAGVDVAQFTNNTKLPEFTGFLKQEIEQGEIQTELEHYNGRNYQTAVLYQTLLYPQHSGDIKIDAATFEAVLRVQTRGHVRSIFDDFFGSYTNVTKMLTAPEVTIHVSALPAGKPSTFLGGVGQFNLTSNISATEVATNEAITLKLDIKGNGNMKLLKTPAVDWPEGFEVYDPKVTNNFKTTTSGVSGTKTIEYLAIPRAAGKYTIPSIGVSYFDTKEKTYKTLRTPEYTLNVKRAAGEFETAAAGQAGMYVGVQKEDIKEIGTDIRYIYTDELPQITSKKSKSDFEFGIVTFWMAYLIPLLLTIIMFIVFRKRIRENADQVRVRYKHANKAAQKRLKKANKLLQAGDQVHFYEEIERAAFTYLSDRLSIPTSELSKDNITDILNKKNVSEQLIKDTLAVLTTAEFARYAPASNSQMEDLYQQTTQLINNLENQKI